MKQKLVEIYQLLDQVGVVGQRNIFALGNALNSLMIIIKELEMEELKQSEKEKNKPIIVDNTKKKEE